MSVLLPMEAALTPALTLREATSVPAEMDSSWEETTGHVWTLTSALIALAIKPAPTLLEVSTASARMATP